MEGAGPLSKPAGLRELCAKFNLTKLKDYHSVTLGEIEGYLGLCGDHPTSPDLDASIDLSPRVPKDYWEHHCHTTADVFKPNASSASQFWLLAQILVRLLMYEACPSKNWSDWVVACKPARNKKYPQPAMDWKAEVSEGILLVPVTRWPKNSGSLMNYQANRVKYARAATVLNHIFPMDDVGVQNLFRDEFRSWKGSARGLFNKRVEDQQTKRFMPPCPDLSAQPASASAGTVDLTEGVSKSGSQMGKYKICTRSWRRCRGS
eukprot:g67853.t1